MFKKKKKKDVILEEEVIAVTSKEVNENIEDEEEIVEIEEIEEVEAIKDIQMVEDTQEEINETEELIVGDFTYYDSDPSNECSVDEDETEEIIENTDKKDKKELDSYFEKSKKDNSSIKEKPVKVKKKSKRQKNKETEFSNIKDQRVFVFRKKKYSKVEDFIKYLNNHYLEIDTISQEVLDDENFYGWISKKSGVFEDSIKQFKEIKEKIEKK